MYFDVFKFPVLNHFSRQQVNSTFPLEVLGKCRNDLTDNDNIPPPPGLDASG